MDYPTSWSRYAVAEDGKTVTVTFAAPPEEAVQVAGFRCEAHPTYVRVGLRLRDSSSTGADAKLSIVERSASVELDEPLAGRPIVDGWSAVVEPEGPLADSWPVRVERVDVAEDDLTLVVYFVGGNLAQFGLEEVRVTEDAESVRVGVRVGVRRSDEPAKLVGMRQAAIVRLASLLGDRRIEIGDEPEQDG